MALTEPDIAVIVAVPSATEVTTPSADTVATALLDDVHVTVASLIVVPFWSLTVAVSVDVAPSDVKLKLVADSVIVVATNSATVTEAVPLAEPEVAVIVAVPSATEVTIPDDETVATALSDDDHVTVAPDIVVPAASLTVALSVDVAPNDAKLKLVGDSVIDEAT